MSAVLVQVADAVAALLNTVPSPFSQSFEAKRSYPSIKQPLAKLDNLQVDVVATRHPRSELGTRGSTEYGCRLTIVIRKRFGQSAREEEGDGGRPVGNDAIDEMVLLVEEIHEYLCSQTTRRLSNSDNLDATWEATQIQNTYIDQHLQDHNQFTGIIRADYTASVNV